MLPTWRKSESCPFLRSSAYAREARCLLLECCMRIASGKVVGGRVELDAELPEGASVTVLALEGDETFEADAETEQMLLQAIAQCDTGQTTPMAQLLSELRSRE
jgi:hypothetical protein